jgi:hypothetical protein
LPAGIIGLSMEEGDLPRQRIRITMLTDHVNYLLRVAEQTDVQPWVVLAVAFERFIRGMDEAAFIEAVAQETKDWPRGG